MTWRDVLAVIGGAGAGFLSGTIGIGGGVVFVPTMTVGFKIAQSVAQGTSLVAIVPTAIVGGLTHLRQGNVLREAALWMGGGGVLGAVVGASVATAIPGPVLTRAWAAFLVFSAYQLFVQALRRSPKTPESN